MLTGLILTGSYAAAQTPSTYGTLTIGSADTATADPAVPRPHTKPCVVDLFQNSLFENYTIQNFEFTPPSDCRGPWAKVVFTGDFFVTEGVQYDRTAQIEIGNATIYFGTTPEPSANLSPTWHVERDVTDYSALFETAQPGEVQIYNIVNNTYTGVIHGSAALEFYPVGKFERAPRVPDVVLAFPNEPFAQQLLTGTSVLTQSYALPTNIDRAYLDVYTQSQIGDEFWYTCVPNNLTTELSSCGNTAFREAEIGIDGTPAGVAPVYPWIYTGGLDPYLWRPIPGVQTLDFVPYRVELSPFAGVLSDGHTHDLTLSVYNANNYFQATGTLFLYLDKHSAQVTGEVTENTLSAQPSPTVKQNIKTSGKNVSGTVDVGSWRDFTIAGYVNTSHGKITTRVDQKIDFFNAQKFVITPSNYTQDITQSTTVKAQTTTIRDGAENVTEKRFSYPLILDYSQISNSDGTVSLISTVKQSYGKNVRDKVDGFAVFSSELSNTVSAKDTLELTSSFQLIGNKDQSSSQQYFYRDSRDRYYSRDLTAKNNVLTGVSNGEGCKDDRNHY